IDFLTRPAFKIGTKHFTMGYNFYDSYGKISHQSNENNHFYLGLYGGDDRLGYNYNLNENQTKGYSKYLWGNVLATARWNHIYSAKLYSDITLFYTRYRYKLNQYSRLVNDKTQMIYKTGLQELGVKADYNWYLNNQLILRFGGGFSGNWFNPGLITNDEKSNGEKTNTIVGADNKVSGISSFIYLENEFHLFKQLSFNCGARVSDLQVDSENYLSFEPRLMANFEINGIGALKAGYSRMRQSVHMLSYSGNSFPTDIWLPSNKNIDPAMSDQYSLAFVRSLGNGKYEFSLEAYYKEMSHLLAVKGGVRLVNTRQWDENVEKDGTGTSKGLEVMIQKKQGRTTGWISYTLAKTDRQFANINNGRAYAFKYDRRHSVSIVFNHKLSEKVDFSATWVYGSGYPITLHNATYQTIEPVDYFDRTSESGASFDVTGEAYLYPGKNWLRMRDYHRLDIGFNFHKKKGTKERIWTLGIYNVYNRQNAVFYYFEHKDQNRSNPLVLYQQSGFPFIPTVKYSVKF
ncbi:MAG TPA: TonB-dependent receptor, partial [Sunxiuqinia sp.]|nr:TonB-dependent receptor [Sunxiuqinia sp.]